MGVGREIEREWGEREKERERVCCKGTGRVGRERKRESGEYVRRVRERVCLEMHLGDREREGVKDRKRLSERRKVKHRNGGGKKKKRGLKGDNESEAKGRDCGESVSPSCRHHPMKAQTNQTISKRLDQSQMHGRSTQNQTKNRKLFPCANRIINKTLFYTCFYQNQTVNH